MRKWETKIQSKLTNKVSFILKDIRVNRKAYLKIDDFSENNFEKYLVGRTYNLTHGEICHVGIEK